MGAAVFQVIVDGRAGLDAHIVAGVGIAEIVESENELGVAAARRKECR